MLADAIRREFTNRGTDELTPTLIAQVAVTVLGVSVDRWLDQGGSQPLTELIGHTLEVYRSMIDDHDVQSPSLRGDAGAR